MSRVAIILSVYVNDNFEHMVSAFDSLFEQSYPCDIFVLKDGPLGIRADGFVAELARQEKITLVRRTTCGGLARALNCLITKVLESERYEYLARMDSDDVSLPKRIESQVSYLDTHSEIDVLGTACQEFGADFAIEKKVLPTTHSELYDFSISRCPFIHPTVMFRRRVFEDGNRYPENTSLTEDMALWFELLRRGYQFGNLPDVLLLYRLNEQTVLRRKGLKKAMSEVWVRSRYMILLKRLSIKNCMAVIARIPFHLVPGSVLAWFYKRRTFDSS